MTAIRYMINCSIELVLYYIMLMLGVGLIYQGKPRWKALPFSVLLFVPWVLCALTRDFDIMALGLYLTLALEVIVCRLCFSGITIFKPLWLVVLLYELTVLLSAIMMIIFGVDMKYNSTVELFVVCGIFAVAVVICLTRAREVFSAVLEKVSTPAKVLFFGLLTVNMFFMMVLAAEPEGEEINTQALYIKIAVVAFVFLLIITTGYIFFSSMYSRQLRYAAESFKDQIVAQSKYYENMSERSHELRKIRHDSRNMYIGLKKLISEDRKEEALEMIHNRFRDLEATAQQFYTGNGIVDAILTDKQDKAHSVGANISFEGSFPETGVSPEHLCIIFGNTLDNAIEACARIEKEDKDIKVQCVRTGSYIYITVTNPVAQRVRIKGGLPRTTKADKKAHGLGVYSLNDTVKSCKGKLELDCTDTLFTVNIELFLGQPAETVKETEE